ncbi:MAG: hypothetical protein OJF50_006497 [Nitrospira sp.]|nr:hypothetical protein [Nitrospira sp.]
MPIDTHNVALSDFLQQFSNSLCASTATQLIPRFTPQDLQKAQQVFARFGEPLLPAQGNVAAALAHAYRYGNSAICAAEMSTGKTRIGGAVSALLQSRRTIVLCPPHLVKKWQHELTTLLPGVHASILRSIRDVDVFSQTPAPTSWPTFAIVSREKAKLGYAKRPALVPKATILNEQKYVRYTCPHCGQSVLNADGIPLTPRTIESQDHCATCHATLFTYDPNGPRRIALADYIARQHPGLFDLIILDEAQEAKARASAQALAFALLLSKAKRGLALTGTLSNGKSTSLFYLLWRTNPAIRKTFHITEEYRWVDLFGTWETRTTDLDTHKVLLEGKQSKRRVHVSVREKPGISPHLIPYLVGNTAFFQLQDLGQSLPPYVEHVHECRMDPLLTANYTKLREAARELIPKGRAQRDGHVVSTTIQALLAYPDRAWQGETICDRDGRHQFSLDPVPPHTRLPKEDALISLVHRQQAAGRRVLVYCSHTRTRDITRRLERLLTASGYRTAILPITVRAEKRMDWIDKRTEEGLDVLICNPKAVQTGLDLIGFPTIVWYEPEYSVTVVRQASRRSYRIPQTLPVEVHFLIYKHTAQEHALAHIAAGINASLQTEGDVDSEGVNEYQQPDDLMAQLISDVLDRNASLLSAERMFAKLADTYERLASPHPEQPHTAPPSLSDAPHKEPEPPQLSHEPSCAPRTGNSRSHEEQLTLFAA